MPITKAYQNAIREYLAGNNSQAKHYLQQYEKLGGKVTELDWMELDQPTIYGPMPGKNVAPILEREQRAADALEGMR